MADRPPQQTRTDEHWMSYILPVALIAGLVALLIVIAQQPPDELQPIISQEEWLTGFAGYLIIGAEAAAAYVIGAAVVRAVISYTRHLLDPMTRQINFTERIRLRLGHMLTLGLNSPWPATSCGWRFPRLLPITSFYSQSCCSGSC